MLILLGTAALAVLVIVANVNRSQSQVRGVEVSIRYGHCPKLVSEQTVIDSILAALPDLTAHSVKSIDRAAVADAASHVPYLQNIRASVSVSGKVVVRATQRRPIARLFHGFREMYFDEEGNLMPVSRIGDCSVLVVGGDFTEPLRCDNLVPCDDSDTTCQRLGANAQTAALLKVAKYLDNQRRYRSLIDQLYIERDGNILMVPKLGDHIVELGDAENLDEKFSNLMTFYRRGMPRAGWNTYSKVSLRYRGQVVCTKETK